MIFSRKSHQVQGCFQFFLQNNDVTSLIDILSLEQHITFRFFAIWNEIINIWYAHNFSKFISMRFLLCGDFTTEHLRLERVRNVTSDTCLTLRKRRWKVCKWDPSNSSDKRIIYSYVRMLEKKRLTKIQKTSISWHNDTVSIHSNEYPTIGNCWFSQYHI